jgi:hypothetical protein
MVATEASLLLGFLVFGMPEDNARTRIGRDFLVELHVRLRHILDIVAPVGG